MLRDGLVGCCVRPLHLLKVLLVISASLALFLEQFGELAALKARALQQRVAVFENAIFLRERVFGTIELSERFIEFALGLVDILNDSQCMVRLVGLRKAPYPKETGSCAIDFAQRITKVVFKLR